MPYPDLDRGGGAINGRPSSKLGGGLGACLSGNFEKTMHCGNMQEGYKHQTPGYGPALLGNPR